MDILNFKLLTDSAESMVLIYKCAICKFILKSNDEFKYHRMFHLSPERHACPNIDIMNFSLQQDKTRFIHCSLCDKVLHEERELEEHVNNMIHFKWISVLNNTSQYTLCDIQQNVAQKLINKDMDDNISTQDIVFTKSLYCYICELEILNLNDPDALTEHELSKMHITNMSLKIDNKKSESICISKDCSSVYVCFICNTEFSHEKHLYFHYNTDIHQFRINVLYQLTSDKYINILDTTLEFQKFECTLCKIQANGIRPILDHKYGKKHKARLCTGIKTNIEVIKIIPLQSLPDSKSKHKAQLHSHFSDRTGIKTSSDVTKKIPLQLLPDSKSKSQFSCYICETNVPDFMLIQHLKSKSHIKRLKQSKNIVPSSSKGNKLFSCQACKEFFSTDLQLIKHFRDRKHQDCDEMEISNDNKADAQLVSDKLISESNDEDVFVKKDAPSSLKKKIKLRRPRRLFNLVEFGENYIELCIESGNKNIYNLDANTMYKLRLGITLSLPIETERRFCIPCNKEMSSNLEIVNNHLHSNDHKHKIIEIVSSDKPLSTDLNDFRLACSYMRRSSKNAVLCFSCFTKIENDDSSIYDHIKSKTHIDNCRLLEMSSEIIFQNLIKIWQNIWYFAEKFVCDVCSMKFDSEIEFAQHVEQSPHKEIANKASIDGSVLESYICIYCATYWCSKDNLYVSHCNDSLHKRMLETQDYVVPTLINSVEQILNHYEKTIDFLLHDSDKIDRGVVKSLLKLLETIVRDGYPKVKAHLFGPQLSRTNYDSIDLDVYLDCDDTYHDFTSVEKSRERLSKVLTCFNKHEKTWKIEDANMTTKVLTTKLQNRALNLRCNIQCGNGLVVEKSKLIRFFVKACPDCRKLILFLKKWMLCCRLSGIKDAIFTDNAISMLVIFYLQIENILPSLSHLMKQKNQSNVVAGWETGFLVDEASLPEQTYAVKDHLSRFFNFYAEFNYITDVICPFFGRPMRKRDFVNIGKLPKEMEIYKSLCVRGQAEVFHFDSPMCVQDPIELSENVTAVVTKMQLRMFRQYCLESRKIIDKGII